MSWGSKADGTYLFAVLCRPTSKCRMAPGELFGFGSIFVFMFLTVPQSVGKISENGIGARGSGSVGKIKYQKMALGILVYRGHRRRFSLVFTVAFVLECV